MQVIEEYIFQNHKFPSKSQIAEITGIPKNKCDKIIDHLIKRKELYSVFGGGHGFPEVILTRDMMQSVINTQKRPEWIGEYSFEERSNLRSEMQKLEKELTKYEMFERLLYLTDVPLEGAVAFTLDWLGFKDVIHHTEIKDYADITFEHNDIKAIIEVEGTTKQGDKRKVLQLDGWIKVEIEKGERDPSQMQGFFIVNHFREMEPRARGDSLTDQATKFMKRYQFRFLTTLFLFETVKTVLEGKLTREKAQVKLWDGEVIK